MSEGGLSFWKKMQKQPHQKQHQTQTQLPQPLASSVSPSPMETTTTTTETPQRIMVDFPGGRGPAVVVDVSERSETDEWDLLSRGSSSYHTHSNNNINNTLNNNNNSNNNNNPNHSAAIFVFKAGSVRSINTLDQDHSHNSSTNGGGGGGGGPPSFKIQRTHSNSTIDSNECNDGGLLGPSGKGVLGVDYVEHVILPTDTLQGICIAYKISMTRLRQANHFSGNSLLLAPKKLVIPISKNALKSGFIRVQDTDAKEYKLYSFLAEFPKLGMTEAKAYLELSDWELKGAIQSAKEDVEWEHEMEGADTNQSSLKSGEIRITSSQDGGLQAQGAGIQRSGSTCRSKNTKNNNTPVTPTAPKTTPTTTTSTVDRLGRFFWKNSSSSSAPGNRIVISPVVSNDEGDNNNNNNNASNQEQEQDETRRKNRNNNNDDEDKGEASATKGPAPIVYSPIPAIATKSAQPHDIYQATPQHGSYGVELKPVSLFKDNKDATASFSSSTPPSP